MTDALSRDRRGSATRLLGAVAAGIGQLLSCAEARQELADVLGRRLGWDQVQIAARYGPLLGLVMYMELVPERADHLAFANGDAGDTWMPRLADAVVQSGFSAVSFDDERLRLIVSQNRHHLRIGSRHGGFEVVSTIGALQRLMR